MSTRRRYNPAVYGKLRADFLNRLQGMTPLDPVDEEEERRQALLREIRKGKLVAL